MLWTIKVLILVIFSHSVDNGPHYHNTGVLVYLAGVSAAFNIQLVEYNNFEAGEGKLALDTHFAHVNHKITRWVRVGNCNCRILEVASYSNLNNYRGSTVRDIRTPLGRFKLIYHRSSSQ